MTPISSQKAQVSLETTALAVLAMTALLAMGTYAVRSINAYFKLSEDTVEDSQSETMHQAPWGDETPCFCDLPEEGVCGEEPCNPWQKKFAYICNAECVNPPEFICVDARADCCEAQKLGCAESGCGNRERAWDISCDGEEPLIECRYDPECYFHCRPPKTLPPNSEWCEVNGSPVGPAPGTLTANMPVTFVEDGPPDECSGAMCEAICKDPFVPRDNGEDCYCPPGTDWIEATNECTCIPEPINRWVQKPCDLRGPSCKTVCEDAGGTLTPDDNGMTCLSGENDLCPGTIPESITYCWGRWGGCSNHTYDTTESFLPCILKPFHRTCYRPGQKNDCDKTDISVACHCNFGWTCCGNGVIERDGGEICDEDYPDEPLGTYRGFYPRTRQLCRDSCRTIGYLFNVYKRDAINIDNDYFSAVGDQYYLTVTCKNGKNFYFDEEAICEQGIISCLTGGEGTPTCQIACSDYDGNNASNYAFVCR